MQAFNIMQLLQCLLNIASVHDKTHVAGLHLETRQRVTTITATLANLLWVSILDNAALESIEGLTITKVEGHNSMLQDILLDDTSRFIASYFAS